MSSIPILLTSITPPSEQTSSQIEEDIEMTCEVVLEASEETIPLSSQDHKYHQPDAIFVKPRKKRKVDGPRKEKQACS
jgi:hypothetical protein